PPTLSLHDALPISASPTTPGRVRRAEEGPRVPWPGPWPRAYARSRRGSAEAEGVDLVLAQPEEVPDLVQHRDLDLLGERLRVVADREQVGLVEHDARGAHDHGLGEIGRASCRERSVISVE